MVAKQSVLGLAFVLVAATTIVMADTPREGIDSDADSGYSIKVRGWSLHDGDHETGVSNGRSEVAGWADAPPGHFEWWRKWNADRTIKTFEMKVLDQTWFACHMTPFCGVIKYFAERVTVRDSPAPMTSHTGYLATGAVQKPWGNIWVDGGNGWIWGECDPACLEATEKPSTHIRANPPAPAVAVGSLPGGLGQCVSLVETFSGGDGALDMFFDEPSGEWVHHYDANGDYVWETPPTDQVRFTCSVSPLGGTQVRYTYSLDNLDGRTRTFLVKELTSVQFPNGWSGTLSGYGTESLVIDVSAESVWCERAQATFTLDDGSVDDGAESATPVPVYVSESHRDYRGTPSIIAAVHETAPIRNRLTVTFVGETPASALVCRRSSGGILTVVEALTEPQTDSEIIIYDPGAPEATVYVVYSGNPCNGYRSDPQIAE